MPNVVCRCKLTRRRALCGREAAHRPYKEIAVDPNALEAPVWGRHPGLDGIWNLEKTGLIRFSRVTRCCNAACNRVDKLETNCATFHWTHPNAIEEQQSHRPDSAQHSGRPFFLAHASLLAPYRPSGYARRRLACAKNPRARHWTYVHDHLDSRFNSVSPPFHLRSGTEVRRT